MSDRKNELFNYFVTVAGKGPSEAKSRAKKTSEADYVRKMYEIEPEKMIEYLDEAIKNHKGLKQSIKKFDEKISTKYQALGIEQYKVESKTDHYNPSDKNPVTFYHLRFGFVFREKEEIKKIDTKKYVPQTIELGATEYQYISLHGTFVPTFKLMILENKCHNGPVTEFFTKELISFLNHDDYNLDTDEELEKATHFKLKPKISKNFVEVLEKQYKKMTEFSFTMGRPNIVEKKTIAEEEVSEMNNEVFDVVGDVLAHLAGDSLSEDEFDKNPFKKIKITVQVDESFEKGKLSIFRKKAKEQVKGMIENVFVRESSVSFGNVQDDEFEKIVMRGLTSVRKIAVEPKNFSDAEKMWADQRDFFFEVKKQKKGKS